MVVFDRHTTTIDAPLPPGGIDQSESAGASNLEVRFGGFDTHEFVSVARARRTPLAPDALERLPAVDAGTRSHRSGDSLLASGTENIRPKALSRNAVFGFDRGASFGRDRPLPADELAYELLRRTENSGQLTFAAGCDKDFVDNAHALHGKALLLHPSSIGPAYVGPDTQAMLNGRSEAEIIAEKVRHVLGREDVPPIADIARACGHTKQAVNGWKKSGRITKRNLAVLAETTGFPLWWWTDPTVAFDAYLQEGLDRPPVNRPNGLPLSDEAVTKVTGIPDPFNQDLFDALPIEQRRVIAKVSALLVVEFTQLNAPPRGRKQKLWKGSHGEVQQRGRERRPGKETKKKGGRGGRSSG